MEPHASVVLLMQQRSNRASLYGSKLRIALSLAVATLVQTLSAATAAPTRCDTVKLLPSDGSYEDIFGSSVAIDGDFIIVGAPDHNHDVDLQGAAYLFIYDSLTGRALGPCELLPQDAELDDRFGWSVAISQRVAVCGVPFDDDRRRNAGAIRTFDHDLQNSTCDAGNWDRWEKLFPVDGFGQDSRLGYGCAISEDVIVAGKANTDPAFVFRYRLDEEAWIHEGKLEGDGQINDGFGNAVDIDASRVVVGAYQHDDGEIDNSGAVFVYRYQNGVWLLEATLRASDAADEDRLGTTVAISGDWILAGAPGDDDRGESTGAVYAWKLEEENWIFRQKFDLPQNVTANDLFGAAVDLDGDLAVVGVPLDDIGILDDVGSVYTYRLNSGNEIWNVEEQLLACDGNIADYLGMSVACSDGRVVAGAPGGNDPQERTGAAYLFDLSRTPCLGLEMEALIQGAPAGIAVSGGAPGEQVVVLWGLERGRTTLDRAGWCVDFCFTVPNGQFGRHIAVRGTFDLDGMFIDTIMVPGGTRGMRFLFQAAARNSCPTHCMSCAVERVVQ